VQILVLNGSPKKNSDTMNLTKAFLSGIEQIGTHSIEIINVIEKEIRPCTGCFACWKIKNGKCIQNDFQNEILEKIINADLVIWSFPLYCYGMPSHLKAVVDRMIPLLKMSMTVKGDAVRHDTLIDLSLQHHVVISGGGFPEWSGNFEGLKSQCRHIFFSSDLTMICVPETPMLSSPAAVSLVQPLLEKFKKAGEYYAENMELTEDIVKALETPVLPGEVYIQIVNSQLR